MNSGWAVASIVVARFMWAIQVLIAPHFRVEGDRSVHYGPFDCTAPGGLPTKEIGSCC